MILESILASLSGFFEELRILVTLLLTALVKPKVFILVPAPRRSASIQNGYW